MTTYTVVLVSRSWDNKRTLKMRGEHPTREAADKACKLACETYEADYRALGPIQLKRLQAEIKAEQDERRKKGAVKAAKTRKARGPNNFVRCPTCGAKSKKLFSEGGGIETRTCRNGHHFEKDKWMGGIIPARRVERTDRPFIVSGSYVDYVYGRFKNDPAGKKG